jgi:hypothetical protein
LTQEKSSGRTQVSGQGADIGSMEATHIQDLAGTISEQALAIKEDRVIGPKSAAVKRLKNNIETLEAWIGMLG